MLNTFQIRSAVFPWLRNEYTNIQTFTSITLVAFYYQHRCKWEEKELNISESNTTSRLEQCPRGKRNALTIHSPFHIGQDGMMHINKMIFHISDILNTQSYEVEFQKILNSRNSSTPLNPRNVLYDMILKMNLLVLFLPIAIIAGLVYLMIFYIMLFIIWTKKEKNQKPTWRYMQKSIIILSLQEPMIYNNQLGIIIIIIIMYHLQLFVC